MMHNGSARIFEECKPPATPLPCSFRDEVDYASDMQAHGHMYMGPVEDCRNATL